MKVYALKTEPSDSLKIAALSYIQAKDQPNWHFPLHAHDDLLELSLVVAGEVELYFNRHCYTLRRGDIAIKNAGTPHAEVSNPLNPVEQICIGVSGIHLPGYKPNQMISDTASPIISTGDSFEYLMQSARYLMKLCEKTEQSNEQVREAVLKGFLSVVYNLLSSEDSRSETVKGHKIVQEVIAYIDKNYHRKIDLEALAKQFYISPFYLSRKFKQETGYTINQYVVNRRIGEAECILIFEDMSVKEVAQCCGYNNLPYFYTVFRKYTGCTPIEFRNRYL